MDQGQFTKHPLILLNAKNDVVVTGKEVVTDRMKDLRSIPLRYMKEITSAAEGQFIRRA